MLSLSVEILIEGHNPFPNIILSFSLQLPMRHTFNTIITAIGIRGSVKEFGVFIPLLQPLNPSFSASKTPRLIAKFSTASIEYSDDGLDLPQ